MKFSTFTLFRQNQSSILQHITQDPVNFLKAQLQEIMHFNRGKIHDK